MVKDELFNEDNDELDNCGCEDMDCDSCGYEDDGFEGETTIVMSDAEGNEYEFLLYDEFMYNDQTFLLLMTVEEADPELVIVKVVEGEDNVDTLVSIDEEEYDEVFAEYLRICEEEDDGYEDDLEET